MVLSDDDEAHTKKVEADEGEDDLFTSIATDQEGNPIVETILEEYVGDFKFSYQYTDRIPSQVLAAMS